MALLSPEFVNTPSTLLKSGPDSTQAADQPRLPPSPRPRTPTRQRASYTHGGGTEGGPLHDQFDGPSAPRHATAPNHSRTSGAGCPTPARTDSHALPALGPPGSGSPPSPVADHASPAWRASLPARAAPAPARRRRPAAAGMPPPSTPPDPLPLPVFSLSTLSFPPTAFAQSGE